MASTSHRITAGLFGLVAVSATAYFLAGDLLDGAPVTSDHVQAAAALFLALGAGHFTVPAFREGKYLSGLALGLVFAAATLLVVASSAGRNADASRSKAAQATSDNAERQRIEADLKQARQDHGEAKKAEKTECVKIGEQCDRKTRRTEAAWRHVLILEARLKRTEPEKTPNGKVRAVAEVLAALPFVTTSVDAFEARLTLLLPYCLALACEVGALAFFGVAFGTTSSRNESTTDGCKTPSATVAGPMSATVVDVRQTPVFPGRATISETIGATVPATIAPPPLATGECAPKIAATDSRPLLNKHGDKPRSAAMNKAEEDLRVLIASGVSLPTQAALAKRWHVDKATVSRWLADFERRGIITRSKEGRRVEVRGLTA